VTAIALLILETRNDWVRFHAFQSLLLTAVILLLHIFFLWSSVLSLLLFLVEIILFWSLACAISIPFLLSPFSSVLTLPRRWRAFHDAELLRRWHIPVLGDLAARWVEEE
jgi:uncharacterized membrane protein